MKRNFIGLLCVLSLLLTTTSWKKAEAIRKPRVSRALFKPSARELLDNYIDDVYQSAHLEQSGLLFSVFKKAFTGFINLKAENKLPDNASVLSVIDFTKPSTEKRLWIIDVAAKNLVLKTWVAHGERSGFNIPTHFSDRIDSKESSLGFYITDNVYYGHNGRSLRLDGMDEGFNDNARTRAIVVHGADYVSKDVIDMQGRLGRSFGCPAVSKAVIDEVIDTIKDKTVLFINGISSQYNSKYLNEDIAADYLMSNSSAGYTASL